MRSGALALAGIVATAVVGVAGATSSWLIARGDQASRRSLEHDARVYDRRANTYVGALRYLQSLDRRIQDVTLALVNEQRFDLPRPENDPGLRASLSAYASPDALKAFDSTVAAGLLAFDRSEGVASASVAERDQRFGEYIDTRDRFRRGLATFQAIVRREIG